MPIEPGPQPLHYRLIEPGRILVLAAVVLFLTGTSNAETVIWSEEFNSDSALACSVWSYDTGDGCAQGICGWGNNEFQEYTSDPANVRVEGGHLVITALRQTVNGPNDPGADVYNFTSGRIKTKERLTLQYGTVEARIQLPDLADGLWPAFWTLGSDIDTVGWPACGEVDIFEMGSAEVYHLPAAILFIGCRCESASIDYLGPEGSSLATTGPTPASGRYFISMLWLAGSGAASTAGGI